MGSEWWRETVVYQIYPRSFADANGDGIGDLAGIIDRLDYLAELGVETIWLSPFYQSPQADVGYDISDYRSIAPEYGSMEDCERLIDEIHRRDMRVVFDMVLNHTSDQHPWFLESRSSRDNPKRDWYVWRDGRRSGGRKAPNNWRSMVGGSGWHYDEGTDQWYWAQFLPFQPDSNYRNPELRAEMLDTMRFWLDRGVDGFRLDIVNALFEDEEFRNNRFKWTLFPSDEDPTMLFRGSERTLNHPDTLAFMKELRAVADEYDAPPRFLVGEVNGPMDMVRAHCGEEGDGLNLVFLFRSLKVKMHPTDMRELMEDYEEAFPPPLLPTWVFGNHDRKRRISRLRSDLPRARLNAVWQLTARGVPFIYYGEEIGMEQQRLRARDSQDALARRMKRTPQWVFDLVAKLGGDSLNRDECRTPMQWAPGPNAGFCPEGVRPWLPTPGDTKGRTVAEQREEPRSLLSCYRRFLRARRASAALRGGDMTLVAPHAAAADVVVYTRSAADEKVAVFINLSERPGFVLNPCPGGRVLVSTDPERQGVEGETVEVGPWEGLVVG